MLAIELVPENPGPHAPWSDVEKKPSTIAKRVSLRSWPRGLELFIREGGNFLVLRPELFFFLPIEVILVSSVKINYTTPLETNWRLNAVRLVANVTESLRTLTILFTSCYDDYANVVEVGRMSNYFPMQKVEKIRLRMSSDVVCPVRESRAHRAR